MKVWLKDSVFYSGSRLVAGAISIVTIPVIVSLFGAETYGKYSQYLSLVNFLSILSIGGVNQIYLRNRNAFSSPFELLVVSSILCMVITTFFSYGSHYSVLFSVGLGSIIFYSSTRVVLQADRMILNSAISETLKQIAMLLSVLILTRLFPPSISVIVSALVLSNLVFVITSAYKYPPQIKIDVRSSVRKFLLHWKYGAGIVVWAILAALLPLADRFLIPILVSESMLGPYAVIADLSQKISSVLILPLAFSVLPLINSNNLNDDFFGRGRYYIILLFSSIGLSGMVLTAYWIASKLNLIEDFSNSIAIGEVYLICLGLTLLQLSILAHKIFEIKGHTKYMVYFMSIAVTAYFLVILSTYLVLGIGSFYLANIVAGCTYIILCAYGAKNVSSQKT